MKRRGISRRLLQALLALAAGVAEGQDGAHSCVVEPGEMQEAWSVKPRADRTGAEVVLRPAAGKLRYRMKYSELKAVAQEAADQSGLRFRVVYRPADCSQHAVLLATNPHLRPDVKVGSTHEVVLYVGWHPFLLMPNSPLKGMTPTAASALLKRAGLEPICMNGGVIVPCDGTVAAASRVVEQWPEPGKALGRESDLNGFKVPGQRPLLMLGSGGRDPLSCPDVPGQDRCPVIEEPVPPHAPPSDVGPAFEVETVLVTGGLGVAGGLFMARALGGGSTPVRPAPEPRGGHARAAISRKPATRVRLDLDSTPGNFGAASRYPADFLGARIDPSRISRDRLRAAIDGCLPDAWNWCESAQVGSSRAELLDAVAAAVPAALSISWVECLRRAAWSGADAIRVWPAVAEFLPVIEVLAKVGPSLAVPLRVRVMLRAASQAGEGAVGPMHAVVAVGLSGATEAAHLFYEMEANVVVSIA